MYTQNVRMNEEKKEWLKQSHTNGLEKENEKIVEQEICIFVGLLFLYKKKIFVLFWHKSKKTENLWFYQFMPFYSYSKSSWKMEYHLLVIACFIDDTRFDNEFFSSRLMGAQLVVCYLPLRAKINKKIYTRHGCLQIESVFLIKWMVSRDIYALRN